MLKEKITKAIRALNEKDMALLRKFAGVSYLLNICKKDRTDLCPQVLELFKELSLQNVVVKDGSDEYKVSYTVRHADQGKKVTDVTLNDIGLTLKKVEVALRFDVATLKILLQAGTITTTQYAALVTLTESDVLTVRKQ